MPFCAAQGSPGAFWCAPGTSSASLCNASACDCCLRARQGNARDLSLQTLGVTTRVLSSHINTGPAPGKLSRRQLMEMQNTASLIGGSG